jgi:two-component system sensor histidine kinase/response regulator
MGIRILLVEDEHELRENLVELLEIEGFSVLDAPNGADALALLDVEKVDIIVSDIMMPGMDGYEFLKQVRGNSALVNVPFVFLTAKAGRTEIRRGMDKGAEDYVTKPVYAADLVAAVRSSIEKRDRRNEWISSNIRDIVDSERQVRYHELRTPLFGILSSLDLLLRMKPEELGHPENIELLSFAHQSATRLNKSLLKLTLYQEVSSLDQVAERQPGMRTSLERALDRHEGMREWTSVGGEDHPFDFSSELWGFVVYELLDNCRKFRTERSSVTVQMHSRGVTFKNSQEFLEDNVDFPICAFSQVGRDFYEFQGLGLGLYLSRAYVAHFGGQLNAYTDENADFVVDITFQEIDNP